ncbi:MAG: hypothetical protein R3D83_01760 [Caenibius sp.]
MQRLVFLLSLALSACVTYQVKSDGIVRARLGEAATLGQVTVVPLKLLEDSRCPAVVQCVWAGRVRIEARLGTGMEPQLHELTGGQPLTLSGGTLELVEVEPEAKPDRTIYPEDYRFGFRFRRGDQPAF